MAKYDFVLRPFEGLADEPDWVAMREIIPAATAVVRTTKEHGDAEVTLTTVLPSGWSAIHRNDGVILVALQTLAGSGDASADLAELILAAIAAKEGDAVENPPLPTSGLRLQDILVDTPLDLELRESFDYWVAEDATADADVKAAIEEADQAVFPTKRVPGLDHAYWCRMGNRTYVRWVRPEDEDAVLDALARVHGERKTDLGGQGKVLGAFRAQGLLIPVWEVDSDLDVDDLAEPFAALAKDLDAAFAASGPLPPEARRARAGLVSRQVTLR